MLESHGNPEGTNRDLIRSIHRLRPKEREKSKTKRVQLHAKRLPPLIVSGRTEEGAKCQEETGKKSRKISENSRVGCLLQHDTNYKNTSAVQSLVWFLPSLDQCLPLSPLSTHFPSNARFELGRERYTRPQRLRAHGDFVLIRSRHCREAPKKKLVKEKKRKKKKPTDLSS